MTVIEAIYKRRAIKHFDPAFEIPEKDLWRLIEVTMQAPTSFNLQHWRFVIIRDKDLRQQVFELGLRQPHLLDASVLVLFTGDKLAWKKNTKHLWRNAPEAVQKFMVDLMGPFHEGREAVQYDEAMRSIGIAMQTMMLAAQEMGYDSCPTIGFDHSAVAKLVGLPDDHIIGPFVALGKRTQEPWPKPGPLTPQEVVYFDRFPA